MGCQYKRERRKRCRHRPLAILAAKVLLAIGIGLATLEVTLRLAWGEREMVPRYFISVDPLPGFALAPGVVRHYIHDSRSVTVTTDDMGKRQVACAPASGYETVVHLVGDSQVFGWGLTDEETIAVRLQEKLGNRFRVVNHGVPGYGPFAYRLMLNQISFQDIVILAFSEQNDLWNAYSAVASATARHGYLIQRTFLGENLPAFVLHSRVFQISSLLKIRFFNRLRALPMPYNPYVQAGAKVLMYRVESLYVGQKQSRGNRMIFVSIPWDAAILPARARRYSPYVFPPRLFVQFPDDCHLASRFRSHPDPATLYLPTDNHLAAAGAEFAAQIFAETIRERLRLLGREPSVTRQRP